MATHHDEMATDSPPPPPPHPPLKPAGRTLAEFEEYIHTDGLPLWPAERKLLEAVRNGEVCYAGAYSSIGYEPENKEIEDNSKNVIRASFIRFLAFGGDDRSPVHERGIRVRQAEIEGVLDLESIICKFKIRLECCNIKRTIIIDNSSLKELSLNGSTIEYLSGVCAKIEGDVLLSFGFVARGQVDLSGANIGGNINCSGARFEHSKAREYSVDLSSTHVKGSIYLRYGLIAKGSVKLMGAVIDGDLDFSDARFEATTGGALILDGASILGRIFFIDVKVLHNERVSFSSVRSRVLVDELEAWPGAISIEGFQYEDITGISSKDPAARIAWLDKNLGHRTDLPFSPKPWEQLIKVLRASGHEAEARKIAIAKEDRLRKDSRIRNRKAKDLIRWPVAPFHALFGLLAGYGYAPFRLVGILTGVWLACAGFFLFAAEQGVFSPTNPLVFQNPALAHCSPDDDEAKRRERALAQGVTTIGANTAPLIPPKFGNWYLCPDLPAEYTTFDALLYSLDLILPLVELQQDKDWAPMICTPRDIDGSRVWLIGWFKSLTLWDSRPACGLRSLTRFVMWFEILFGWVASLMLVAAVTRLASRD